MNWDEIRQKVGKLKADIVTEMNNLVKLSARNDNLPAIPSTFMSVKEMIELPSYDVVVCGEVKKGKSSLLNAIIGQEILPVDNEIATSQVFRINNCSQEGYALVFTDGYRKPINREELSRYGSQVDTDLEKQELFNEHTLSYIEVNIPVEFLPNGVSLVDTPGLGSLYKTHEWITQNYVKNASAVVFVMDPERTLNEKEREFILKVLSITPHIMYVMTKIDKFTGYEEILARNEELLALIYADRGLKAPHIFPVSSKALKDFKNGKVEVLKASYWRNSHFSEFKEHLLLLSFKAIGLTRVGVAFQEISNHYAKAKQVIEDMLNVTVSENLNVQMKINEQKRDLQKRMRVEYGTSSSKWLESKETIAAICNSVRSKVQQLVSTGGSTFKHYEDLIDNVKNSKDLNRLKTSIDSDLKAEIDQQWSSIMRDAQKRVNNVLYNYHLQIDSENGYNAMSDSSIASFNMHNFSAKDYLPPFRNAFWITSILSGIIGAILGPLAGFLAIPLVATISFRLFWTEEKKRKIKRALVEIFNEISRQMLHVQNDKIRSLVDEFSYQLRKSADIVMNKFLEEKEQQIQQEITNLDNQARLDAEKRQKQHEEWELLSKEWSNEAVKINELIKLYKELESSLNQ